MLSIRDKHKQVQNDIISMEEYVRWMQDHHGSLTFGDWTAIEDYDDMLDAKNDAEGVIANMSSELGDAELNLADVHQELAALKRTMELNEGLAKSATNRLLNQANIIGELQTTRDKLRRDLQSERGCATLGEGKEGDWVVIHTTVNYPGSVTVVPEDEFSDYFREDMGWDIEQLPEIRDLEPGSHMYTDMGCAIIIVRI